MALAVPPKNSEREFSILSAFQISQKDCQNLINLHKNSQNPQKQGRVIDDGSNVVNLSTRDVDVWVIHENNIGVDELMLKAAIEANKSYDMQITGIIERPQLLRYTAPSNGYGWHLDIGRGDASTRKISVSLLLNDDYEGGELGFFSEKESFIRPETGMAVCFPAFMPHCVKPITKGERWSLVCWVGGEPLR